jgi:hypothetical protein
MHFVPTNANNLPWGRINRPEMVNSDRIEGSIARYGYR